MMNTPRGKVDCKDWKHEEHVETPHTCRKTQNVGTVPGMNTYWLPGVNTLTVFLKSVGVGVHVNTNMLLYTLCIAAY